MAGRGMLGAGVLKGSESLVGRFLQSFGRLTSTSINYPTRRSQVSYSSRQEAFCVT